MLLASLALASAAAALLVGPAPALTGRPAGVLGAEERAGPGRRPGGRRLRGRALVGAAAAGCLLLAVSLTGTQLAVSVVAAGAGAVVVRMVAASRDAGEAARRRESVVGFCEALVGELRAGQPVLVALERSAVAWPEVVPVLSAARIDADLPAALRRLAAVPGAEAVSHLAAAWQLCAATGGGLTDAAAQVLESARADAAELRQVEGEVSSARATARLVAALPVVVLTAGQGLGARPWAFLLGHPMGVGCLACGALLVLLGLGWIDRIAGAATSAEQA